MKKRVLFFLGFCLLSQSAFSFYLVKDASNLLYNIKGYIATGEQYARQVDQWRQQIQHWREQYNQIQDYWKQQVGLWTSIDWQEGWKTDAVGKISGILGNAFQNIDSLSNFETSLVEGCKNKFKEIKNFLGIKDPIDPPDLKWEPNLSREENLQNQINTLKEKKEEYEEDLEKQKEYKTGAYKGLKETYEAIKTQTSYLSLLQVLADIEPKIIKKVNFSDALKGYSIKEKDLVIYTGEYPGDNWESQANRMLVNYQNAMKNYSSLEGLVSTFGERAPNYALQKAIVKGEVLKNTKELTEEQKKQYNKIQDNYDEILERLNSVYQRAKNNYCSLMIEFDYYQELVQKTYADRIQSDRDLIESYEKQIKSKELQLQNLKQKRANDELEWTYNYIDKYGTTPSDYKGEDPYLYIE